MTEGQIQTRSLGIKGKRKVTQKADWDVDNPRVNKDKKRSFSVSFAGVRP